ncbi:MAG: hypothetical protein ACE5IZ_07125, partial [Dehalococcoidia bacterium]
MYSYDFMDTSFYFDFAADPADACVAMTYRASAVSTTGAESALSNELVLAPALLPPENLMVPAEPIDPPPCGLGCFQERLNPQAYGLTLTWSPGGSTCGDTLVGYHAYRSRLGGGAPIRITREPVGVPVLRVEYLPLHGPNAGGKSASNIIFSGPFGLYGDSPGDPSARQYAVTAVDANGNESVLSNVVWAHTDAAQPTGACLRFKSCPPAGPPVNYEYDTGSLIPPLRLPDSDTLVPPGPPTALSWAWRYGRDPNADVGPEAGNWALVTWSPPATGAANDFRLLRRTATDADFQEVELDPIPPEDTGLRQFVWKMPLELACQDANYALRAVDLYGRPAATDPNGTSAAIFVPAHNLIPENPTLASGGTSVEISWDPLIACGPDPNHLLAGYTVYRSVSSVATCDASTMTADEAAYEAISGLLPASQTSLVTTPADPAARYWYRVKAHWDESATKVSGFSAGVCLAASDGVVPEGLTVTGMGAWVQANWDPVADPFGKLLSYNLYRTTVPVSGCWASTMPTDPNAYTLVASTADASQTSLDYTPPAEIDIHWYRVTSVWSWPGS